jgi:hypothetical protein
MGYFNYHGIVKKLILDGKLIGYKFVDRHNGISPALLLFFCDSMHPVMPIRREKWDLYQQYLTKDLKLD